MATEVHGLRRRRSAQLIREGKTHQIHSAMQAGAQHGMQTLDQHLAELVRTGRITYERGLEKCHHIEDFNAADRPGAEGPTPMANCRQDLRVHRSATARASWSRASSRRANEAALVDKLRSMGYAPVERQAAADAGMQREIKLRRLEQASSSRTWRS